MLSQDTKTASLAAMITLAQSVGLAVLPSEQKEALDSFIANEAKNAWFSAYNRDNDNLSLREANHIADVLIEANRSGQDPVPLLIESGVVQPASVYHAARETCDEIFSGFEHDFEEAGVTEDQLEALRDYLLDALSDKMIEEDTSTVSDSWSSYDRAEVLFIFSGKEHAIDAALTSHRPWPEFSEMVVCEDLRHTLACLGYTVGEYRAASGNKHDSTAALRLARPAFARPNPPLCSLEKVAEAIDNACTTTFVFCLYAIVPLADLAKLDPGKPLTFTKAHVASYSPWAGTFHDCAEVRNVTVAPAMGKLISAHGYYSPDDICGFVTSYYHGNIANPGSDESLAKAA